MVLRHGVCLIIILFQKTEAGESQMENSALKNNIFLEMMKYPGNQRGSPRK